jgi:hypothetical protein
MTFRTQKIITRDDLRNHPETLYVFGDNVRGTGYGGQAAVMRGEPNAIGIVTKWLPSTREEAYFCDEDLEHVEAFIAHSLHVLEDHLRRGGDVVWPEDGIGTGRAQLPTRAPQIFAYIERGLARLQAHFKEGP